MDCLDNPHLDDFTSVLPKETVFKDLNWVFTIRNAAEHHALASQTKPFLLLLLIFRLGRRITLGNLKKVEMTSALEVILMGVVMLLWDD